MRVTTVLDGGMARSIDTGVAEGHDKVSALQSAIKQLVKSKEVMACNVEDIEVYPLGITKRDYQGATPLKPDDDLPKTTKSTPIFIHAPHEQQQLQGSHRKMARASYEGGHHLTNDEKIAIPKFKCYYKLGDTIPYYIEVMGWETTVGRLKERILETRGERGTAPDLYGVHNITQFQIFPPGRDEKTGKPLYAEMDDYDAQIPTHSTMKNPFIVPAVRNTAASDAAKEAMRKAREAKKTKKKRDSSASKSPAPPKKKTGITVQVKTPDGTMLPVKLTKASDTVQLIKETIAPDCGVEVEDQVLHFGGKEITDEQTAKELGFKSGSVINLLPPPSPPEPSGITVQVRTPEGTRIPVEIDPVDTIEFIKERLAAESGIEVPDQILLFHDEELPNDKTAEEMELKDGSFLDLEQKPIIVQVRTPDGVLIPVKILPTDTIRFIKEQLEPETGMEVPDQVLKFEDNPLPNNETTTSMGLKDGSIIDLEAAQPKPITVQVRTPDEAIIPVEILPSDSIHSIKDAVAPGVGIKAMDQVLTYEGVELPSEATADDTGLQDGSVIDLAPQLITVNVKTPEGKLIPVTINSNDSIATIKQAVEQETGVEVPKQTLTFENSELLNDKSAVESGLSNGDIIDLAPHKITVQVRMPEGKMIPVTIESSDPISSIKEAVAPESGISPDQQILSFEGTNLPDSKSADSMGLQDGSVIDLEPRTMMVQVRTTKGKLIPVPVKPTSMIRDIKEAVAEESGMNVTDQLMMFGEKELVDGDTADASGLKDGDIIDLEPKVITVQVRTPEGQMIPVTIDPFDKIESIKAAVGEEVGVPILNQLMIFNDKELVDDDTADASGLENGSIIDLEPKVIAVQVRTPSGKLIPVHINPFDKIETIKASVAEEAGIEVPDQLMLFNEEELIDDNTADGSGLKNGSIIDLEPKVIAVQVRTPDGNLILVRIDPYEKIEAIKAAVAEESGIEVPDQLMLFNEKWLVDGDTADGSGLKNGSIIDLEPKTIAVQVRTPDGTLIPVEIDPFEKVQSIKEAVVEQSGIDIPDQIMVFDEKKLVDDDTADASGLKNGSIIDLEVVEGPGITIQVKCPDEQIISLTIQPSHTIASIKEAVAPASGIDVAEQILKYDNKKLPDEETAESMGLVDGCTVVLSKLKPKKEDAKKAKKEKKKKKKDKDWELDGPREYSYEFNPTPQDLSRHKAHFMVGDLVPMVLMCPAAMTIWEMKEEIIRIKNDAQLVKRYLAGVSDPARLQVFPAGSFGEGKPLPDEILVPRNSSPYAMFVVTKTKPRIGIDI